MAGGRPPLPGHSGPRRRVLAGAAGLPGSPHFPHAGSRARPTAPPSPRPGARRRPRLCHVLAAAAAARRPAAPHTPRCRRHRHNTFRGGEPERKTAAAESAASVKRAPGSSPPARAAQGFIRRAGGGRKDALVPLPLHARGPARYRPGSRRSRFDLVGRPRRAHVTRGGRACARRHPSLRPPLPSLSIHTRRRARRLEGRVLGARRR